RQAVAGEPMTVFGDGHQTRCFCHVTDVVDALLRLLGEPAAIGDVFNIGAHEEISMLALASRVKELAGSSSQIELVPYEDVYGPGFADMRRRVPDTNKVQGVTGWRATRTLDDILTETIAEATAERQAELAYPAAERRP
ncbi:MAG: NAD-dependent epimerase/dehydratase, partial [Acidimicrobiales bacterium]|nr:NAD-dependent epimerase/dehydratase [Acidimicrobiales bacterium]